MNYHKEFFNYLEFEKRYSYHTIKSYQIDLGQFSIFCTENIKTDQPDLIDSRLIRKWVVSLMDAKNTSRTVNRKLSAIKSYYLFLLRQKLVTTNPLLKVVAPKVKKRLPVFVEESRMNTLLDEVEFSDDFKGSRNKLIIETFYFTGIRLSELINLKDSDIDTSSFTIKVLGKRNKERIVPITKEFASQLHSFSTLRNQELENSENNYFFTRSNGKKLYPEFVYRVVKAYLQLVTTIDKKSPHILRHTFATQMLNKGADLNAIKELLGHANLSATQVYTHNTFEKLTRIYKQAHPRA